MGLHQAGDALLADAQARVSEMVAQRGRAGCAWANGDRCLHA
jgi:hypothetical protein